MHEAFGLHNLLKQGHHLAPALATIWTAAVQPYMHTICLYFRELKHSLLLDPHNRAIYA